MSWTEERVERLSRLWAEGRSASHIAAELGDGVSRNAVIGKIHRLGLANRSVPPVSTEAERARLEASFAAVPGIASGSMVIVAAEAALPCALESTEPVEIALPSAPEAPPRLAPAPSVAPIAPSVPISSPASIASHDRPASPERLPPRELAPPREPARASEVVIPFSTRVTILDLRETMCRWPLGDPTSSEFRFCGCRTAGSIPYCAAHARVAFQPIAERRRVERVARIA